MSERVALRLVVPLTSALRSLAPHPLSVTGGPEPLALLTLERGFRVA